MFEIFIIFRSAFSIDICVNYNNIEMYLALIKFSNKSFFFLNFCRIWSFSASAFSFVFLILILSIISGEEWNTRPSLYQLTILYKSVLFNILFIIHYYYLHLVLRTIPSSSLHSAKITSDQSNELVYLKYIFMYSAVH